jgi:two-component system, chemotaxis family, CheB/CheR fusion protein
MPMDEGEPVVAAKKRTKGRSKAAGEAEPGRKRVVAPQQSEESATLSAGASPVESEPGRAGPPVAGIGASAGGLDAFRRFFTAMPADSGVAFVLIPHLDPEHESLMVELLARYTKMPVVEATEGLAVEADHLYVIPPNKYMTISDGVLRLTGPVERGGLQTSIDLFLRSLAADRHEKAICIILSGTGSHGSLGLEAVKAADGMAMVQDPTTAEYPRMPESAIATGLADYVLTVEKMPEALLKYIENYYVDGRKAAIEGIEAPDHLNEVLALLRARTKFDFRCYRKPMLTRRIARRMGVGHFNEVADYLAFLRDHPEEVDRLFRDLLISVTSFFRDPEAFQALESEVLFPLIHAKAADAPLRIWSTGCATGEEAYSLGMMVIEQLAAAQKVCHVQIFASDVDANALEVARRGNYPEGIAADVSPERLRRFFMRVDDGSYQVSKHLREIVVFARQNMITDPPFSKLDLIVCRNLLIYLESEVEKKVVALLHFALNEGGYLFLGPSETIGRHVDLFEPVSKKWRVFRRVGPTRPERVEVPIAAGPDPLVQERRLLAASVPRPVSFAEVTQRMLLDQFAPAAVLIDRKYEILYCFGPTDRYLAVAAGEPTQNLMMLAREGLRTKLRSAIHQASRENRPVAIADAEVKRNGDYHAVSVTIHPVQEPKGAEGLLLVTFQDSDRERAPQRPPETPAEASVVRQLEQELKATKEDLEGAIEELESSNEQLKLSNEEVMSLNEEFQSANEELETSKEELQSLNEELNTVNNQLEDQVANLESANDDMANLLNCADVAILFLDNRFRIKRFTAPAVRLFNLIPTDLDRPISDITPKFADNTLQQDVEQVLHTLTPQEKLVQTPDGCAWNRRITLYRTLDNRIEGVVLTFTDVTIIRQADEQMRRSATVLLDSNDAVTVHDFDGRITAWNRGAEEMFGYSEAEALRMNVAQLVPFESLKQLQGHWKQLRLGRSVNSWEALRKTKDGRILQVWATVTALRDETGRPVGIATTERDITEFKTREARLVAILDSAADAIITIDAKGTIQSVNAASERVFGYSAAEMIGQNVKILMPAPYREQHDGYLANYARTRIKKIIGVGREAVARRKDGSTFPVELTVSEVGQLGIFTGILRDITRRKELEREVVEVASLEQRRIGQDLHDSVSQELAALNMMAADLAEILGPGPSAESKLVKQMIDGLRRSQQELRTVMRGLIPVAVDNEGLMAALSDLAERTQKESKVSCKFDCPEPVTVANNLTATHLYLIAQEAVHNAIKHAQPRNIRILLKSNDLLVLSVQDDGTGMPARATEKHGGFGLRIMRNRATIIGATLTTQPAEPTGTLVTCALARKNDEANDAPQKTGQDSDRR